MAQEVEVVGVDGCRDGWVAVFLRAGRFAGAMRADSVLKIAAANPEVAVIAVDIPIGIPDAGAREADGAARAFLRGGGSSVFTTPSRAVLLAGTHAEASALARQTTGRGVTRQSYGLRGRILELDELAGSDPRIIEVHPEICFRALAGERLRHGKRTWNGLRERMRLLASAGIELPDRLGEAGTAAADDVLDAAASAWTAVRFARGEARSLPEQMPRDVRGRPVAIWY